ncbi:MAG: response regulator [Candidatus Omnitrophica bacterium]|nr:response regulator [Candidatus Omnitrophota bacterium]MBU1127842.1 response regulator [Candidatus Omnitrophota bacterium]MBU1784850.1 response regulator [Candidatus Omnitrophota bacterium]MBU1851702.1 response regulator [Candidatus Omnitrophota bacterium]
MNEKTKKKILIIDDEEGFLETTGAWLEKTGYIVLTAPDGEKAIEVMKATSPDLIIVDMGMPVMNGYAFYQRVKDMPGYQDVPVIVTTARIEMRDVLEAEGVAAFLSKPFSLKVLSAQVESLLPDS